MSPKDFITTFRPAVLQMSAKYNVPAAVLMAQIAVESAWLKSHFSQQYHNLTGMKAIGSPIPGIWDGTKSIQNTTEDFDANGTNDPYKDAFRVYKTFTQSIEDLAHRHAIRFKLNKNNTGNDINNFIDAVVNSGYATGTGYYNLLNQIIDTYKLYDLDKGAKFVKKAKKQTPTTKGTTPPVTTVSTPTGDSKKKNVTD